MDEGSKTALAFLGIFAFLGLALFFQADISNLVDEANQTNEEPVEVPGDQSNDSETVQASADQPVKSSSRFTDTFESELGPEYVFDIRTESLEQTRVENGRSYYQASLKFELTDFGQAVADADSESEVETLVEERFESYPEGDFASDLMSDVEAVENNNLESLEYQVLNGSLESISFSGNNINIEASAQGEGFEMKWGSFSTSFTIQSTDITGVYTPGETVSVPSWVDNVTYTANSQPGQKGDNGDNLGETGLSGGYAPEVQGVFSVNGQDISVSSNSPSTPLSGGGNGGKSLIVSTSSNFIELGGGGGGAGYDASNNLVDGASGANPGGGAGGDASSKTQSEREGQNGSAVTSTGSESIVMKSGHSSYLSQFEITNFSPSEPPIFNISSFSCTSPLQEIESITCDVSLENTGSQGSRDVTLNSPVISGTQSPSLSSQESTQIQFTQTTSIGDFGNYTVQASTPDETSSTQIEVTAKLGSLKRAEPTGEFVTDSNGVIQTRPGDQSFDIQYYENFSQYNAGDTLSDLGNWSSEYGPQNTWQIIEDSFGSNKYLEFNPGNTGDEVLKWAQPKVEKENYEVVVKIEGHNQSGIIQSGPVLNIQESGLSGYTSIGDETSGGDDVMGIERYDSGSPTVLANATGTYASTVTEDNIFIRMRNINGEVKLKYWSVDAPEPNNWDFVVNDDTYTGGFVGITGGAAAPSSFRVDMVGAGVSSNESEMWAPTSPP